MATEPDVPDLGEHVPDQAGERLDASKVPDELPDQPVASDEHGTTVDEQRHPEGLAVRVKREQPDYEAAAGAPAEERGLDLIGDLDENGVDEEPELASQLGESDTDDGDDSGEPRPPTSAELAAMHIYDDAPGATDHEVHYEEPGPGRIPEE